MSGCLSIWVGLVNLILGCIDFVKSTLKHNRLYIMPSQSYFCMWSQLPFLRHTSSLDDKQPSSTLMKIILVKAIMK